MDRSLYVLAAFAIVGLALIVPSPPALAQAAEPPVLLGVYPSSNLQTTVGEIASLDSWAGKRNAIAGTFMDFEFPNPDWNVPAELNAAWDAGYTPFVNLMVGYETSPTRTAAYIASGAIDADIRAWAQEFAAWADDGNRQAFLAPLPEMNGDWVPYGLDPQGFKDAFLHIQDIFAQEGVPDASVSWVFAPNGWSDPSDPDFEAYYPGHAAVDVVAFSAYNYGTDTTCNAWPRWDPPETVYGPYLDRMRLMAPMKPIFIAQTATASAGGDKGQWLIDAYTYLANYPAVRAILYFNRDLPACNWDLAIYQISGRKVTEYQTAIAPADFGYEFPIPLAFDPPPAYTFEDVWRAHPFAGVPDHPDWPYVEALYQGGYIAGCSSSPPLYCPEDVMTRAEGAVFVERGIWGAGYVPPQPTASSFGDVDLGAWYAKWAEALWQDGYTAGCSQSPLLYCPLAEHNRAEGAVFYLRMLHGADYTPPAPSVQIFEDVPLSAWYAKWVNQAHSEGLLEPCSISPTLLYCPLDPLTRGQAARMMVRAKGLVTP